MKQVGREQVLNPTLSVKFYLSTIEEAPVPEPTGASRDGTGTAKRFSFIPQQAAKSESTGVSRDSASLSLKEESCIH